MAPINRNNSQRAQNKKSSGKRKTGRIFQLRKDLALAKDTFDAVVHQTRVLGAKLRRRSGQWLSGLRARVEQSLAAVQKNLDHQTHLRRQIKATGKRLNNEQTKLSRISGRKKDRRRRRSQRQDVKRVEAELTKQKSAQTSAITQGKQLSQNAANAQAKLEKAKFVRALPRNLNRILSYLDPQKTKTGKIFTAAMAAIEFAERLETEKEKGFGKWESAAKSAGKTAFSTAVSLMLKGSTLAFDVTIKLAARYLDNPALAKVAPGEILAGGYEVLQDTASGIGEFLAEGKVDRLERVHGDSLKGAYGPVVQGYSMIGELIADYSSRPEGLWHGAKSFGADLWGWSKYLAKKHIMGVDEFELESRKTRAVVNSQTNNGARSQSSPGVPLPPELKLPVFQELSLPTDQVRIHNDAQANIMAERLDADAFVYGEQIFWGEGPLAADSPQSLALLAHELTHIKQNQIGPRAPTYSAAEREQQALRTEQAVQELYHHAELNFTVEEVTERVMDLMSEELMLGRERR